MLVRAAKEDLPGFRLTTRDAEIIHTVYSFRAATAGQIEQLFFTHPKGRPEINAVCKNRLRGLYHHGYLFRDEQPTKLSEGRKPLVYFLDKRGGEFLAEYLGTQIDWKPQDNNVSYPFLDHLLATNDIRVALTVSARAHGPVIAEWVDEKRLKSPQMKDIVTLKGERGARERAAVVPDSFFCLETTEDMYNFFLECDRGTVTLDATETGKRDWMRKIRSYLEYHHSGLYEKRYQTKDMRVLTVTCGEKRMWNLKEVTEEAGGKSRFWFTTFEAFQTQDILTAPIWTVAARDGSFALF